MSGILIILYVINVQGLSPARYGTLVAVQMTTSILVYIPAGRIAGRIGRKTFVVATFLSFAFFPLAVIFARTYWPWFWLLLSEVCERLVNLPERR